MIKDYFSSQVSCLWAQLPPSSCKLPSLPCGPPHLPPPLVAVFRPSSPPQGLRYFELLPSHSHLLLAPSHGQRLKPVTDAVQNRRDQLQICSGRSCLHSQSVSGSGSGRIEEGVPSQGVNVFCQGMRQGRGPERTTWIQLVDSCACQLCDIELSLTTLSHPHQ